MTRERGAGRGAFILALREEHQSHLLRKADCLTDLGFPAAMAPSEAIGVVVPMKVEHGGNAECGDPSRAVRSSPNRISRSPNLPKNGATMTGGV